MEFDESASLSTGSFEIRTFNGRPGNDDIVCDAEKSVFDFLDKLGVEYTTLVHPAAFTMEECEAVRKEACAPVFKNLFLTNKQGTLFFLLMISADKPFKTKYLSSQLGCARLSFASEQNMVDFLQIHPGAVSPMGLIHDREHHVRLIIDSELKNVQTYACHPCVNTASIVMKMSDLLNKVIPATGHDHTWVDLPRLAE